MRRVLLIFILGMSTVYAEDTELIFYQPMITIPKIKMAERKGVCWQQSSLIKREDAWHCQAEGQYYDPCFITPHSDHRAVICLATPWTNAGIKITLDKRLDTSNNVLLDMSKAFPWAVELNDGIKCVSIQSDKKIDNLEIHYYCDNQSYLIGQIQRCSNEWKMLQQKSGEIDFTVIAKAWF